MTTEEMQRQIESMMPTPKQVLESIDKKLEEKMTDDRREISDGEMLLLIDWWLYNKCGDDGKGIMFESFLRSDCNVVLRFEPNGRR